jgi:hypothetical protein
MAIQQKRVTCTTTPTLILGNGESPLVVKVHNASGNAIYLGGGDVTSTTGYHLESTESLDITLVHSNSLYGVTASGSHAVTVIWQAL